MLGESCKMKPFRLTISNQSFLVTINQLYHIIPLYHIDTAISFRSFSVNIYNEVKIYHEDLPWRFATKIYHEDLLWRFTMKIYHDDLPWRFRNKMFSFGHCPNEGGGHSGKRCGNPEKLQRKKSSYKWPKAWESSQKLPQRYQILPREA